MPEPVQTEGVQILPPSRFEGRDARFRHIAAGAAWLALALAVVLLAALWMYPDTMTDQYVARPLPQFAQPQLQASPRADMDRFQAQQLEALNGVYWLDRAHGIVHLPIQDAMRKVAEEGIADWPAPQSSRSQAPR